MHRVTGSGALIVCAALGCALASLVATANDYSPPRTPWGDPDIQGTYTNVDEAGTPMERPAEFAGLSIEDFDEARMVQLHAERQRIAAERAPLLGATVEQNTGAGPTHWFEHLEAQNSQPWLVFDPPDGQIPALTAAARRAAAERAANARPYDYAYSDPRDASNYDRCITRGLPGSMMPAIYGNAYDITQGPGYVAIRYEMIHETRVIPVHEMPPLAEEVRMYMGSPRGDWDGDTLVVVTTNFRAGATYRSASPDVRITERFIPVDDNTLRWEVRFDDPATWEGTWAFGMPLKRDRDHEVFEYACHEGNYGLENILRAARAERESLTGTR
jgi:hypothetical protein